MDSGKKVQIVAWKKAFYQKYFNSGKKLVIGKNPFCIYWVAKLFEACNTDKNITQKDMLKGLSNNYLYWGRLSQKTIFLTMPAVVFIANYKKTVKK